MITPKEATGFFSGKVSHGTKIPLPVKQLEADIVVNYAKKSFFLL